jgi:hypothetical protein
MALTKVSYSMITGAPVNVLDYGADPTGVADSQPAIQAAIDAGALEIIIPSGTYRLNSGLTISKNNPVKKISGFDMSTTLKLYTSTTASLIEVQYVSPIPETKQFFTIENLILDSNGTKADAFATYGILAIGCSYTKFINIRATNFSGAGLECRFGVYLGIDNFTASSCTYGLSFTTLYGVQVTAVVVNRAYITGCKRAITQTGSVNMLYVDCVMEYSGSTTTTDGALHIAGGIATLITPYWEANFRNVVSAEGSLNVVNPYGWNTGTAADVITYVGTAFDQRGITVQYPYNLMLPRINADAATNRDLVIGENLTVPVAGGSVIFGNETMYSANGLLTSGAWTTTYTIPAVESTGSFVNTKALYEYTCYAGASDFSTGFDAGTILNGTLRSYSGSTPAWLRLVGGNLSTVAITGTAGEFSCTSSTLTVGMAVTIAGTFGGTGSITGYTNPKTYYIIATNGTTTFQLSATLGGSAIVTTAGTPTGLTYTIPSYVQMNVTGTSYGLTYKIIMRRVYPGLAV